MGGTLKYPTLIFMTLKQMKQMGLTLKPVKMKYPKLKGFEFLQSTLMVNVLRGFLTLLVSLSSSLT